MWLPPMVMCATGEGSRGDVPAGHSGRAVRKVVGRRGVELEKNLDVGVINIQGWRGQRVRHGCPE